jgi:pyruvate/2-oxoglutarate/acetoin dehydrogenase E1 component
MEHKDLWSLEGDIPDGHRAQLGRARVHRVGSDVTIVSWSKAVHVAAQAAEAASKDGLSVELVDLRTLWPWDRDAVFASVAKTGRLLVVHEAVQAAGFGAEIAATVAEVLDGDLKAPVKRLGAPRIPVAYAPPLEDKARISAPQIVDACRALVAAKRPSRTAAE